MVRSSSSSYRPVFQSARKGGGQTTKGVIDLLQHHDKMAALLPAATRMVALQKDCAATLPTIFDTCAVLQFDSGQLLLGIPNAALAAKLKQQLPKLQEGLLTRGWQVNAIKLKVQIDRPVARPPIAKRLVLPERAVSALDALTATLEDSPRNAALKAALASMVRRHREVK